MNSETWIRNKQWSRYERTWGRHGVWMWVGFSWLKSCSCDMRVWNFRKHSNNDKCLPTAHSSVRQHEHNLTYRLQETEKEVPAQCQISDRSATWMAGEETWKALVERSLRSQFAYLQGFTLYTHAICSENSRTIEWMRHRLWRHLLNFRVLRVCSNVGGNVWRTMKRYTLTK